MTVNVRNEELRAMQKALAEALYWHEIGFYPSEPSYDDLPSDTRAGVESLRASWERKARTLISRLWHVHGRAVLPLTMIPDDWDADEPPAPVSSPPTGQHTHRWIPYRAQPSTATLFQARTTAVLYVCTCGDLRSDTLNGAWSTADLQGALVEHATAVVGGLVEKVNAALGHPDTPPSPAGGTVTIPKVDVPAGDR